MTNRELVERYPFLWPRDWHGNRISEDEYDYSYTVLDDMPEGWRKAFGEQFCEELRNVLLKADYLDEYMVIQVKEKFGGLRWYDCGVPTSIYSEIVDVIHRYEGMSEMTCINCGKPAKYVTTGWISPFCADCIKEIHGNYVPIGEWYEPEESED